MQDRDLVKQAWFEAGLYVSDDLLVRKPLLVRSTGYLFLVPEARYANKLVEDSIKAYDALTGNYEDDLKLMDWLVKNYKKSL